MLPVAEYKAYILHARPVGCQFSLCAAVPGSVLLTTLLYPWQSFHSAECREHATSASTNMQSSRMFTPTHVQLTNGGQVPRDLAVDHCTGCRLLVLLWLMRTEVPRTEAGLISRCETGSIPCLAEKAAMLAHHRKATSTRQVCCTLGTRALHISKRKPGIRQG